MKEQLASGAYRVDAQAVADAVLRSPLLIAALLRPMDPAAGGGSGR